MPDYEPELVPSVDSFFLVLVIFSTFNSMKKYGDLREKFTTILGSQSKRGERLPQDRHQIAEKECQPQGARARATEFTFPLLCRDVLRSPLFGWIWRDEKQYVRQNPLCTVEEILGRSR